MKTIYSLCFVMLTACAVDQAAPTEPEMPVEEEPSTGYRGLPAGTGAAFLEFEASPDSNASQAPFRVASVTVSGSPDGQLGARFAATDGIRDLTFDLTGPFTLGKIFRGTLTYAESAGMQWVSQEDNEFNGVLIIEAITDTGLTFALDSHQMVASGSDAVAVVRFEGSGNLAFP